MLTRLFPAVLLFLVACTTSSSPADPPDPGEMWANALRVWGTAIVHVELVPAMHEYAPELFRLLDKDVDQALSTDELLAFDPLRTDPVTAIVIYATVKRLVKRFR